MLAQPLSRGGPAPGDGLVLQLPDADHRPRGRPGERLHHLFEARCDALAAAGQARHPAVHGATGLTSYPELDALANRLAHHLHGQGLRPGHRVALLLDRSAWSYAAMLAVLKLHAAYVPLDTSFPPERIAFIVQDAGVSRLLSQASLQPLLAACPVPVTLVDTLGAALAALPASRPEVALTGPPVDELCYVIYTSGSTGVPKGVPIDHAQVVNFVHVAAQTYGYRPDDRVYQGLTLAFDFAVEEIWVPLAVGATLLPNDSGASLLGTDLAGFLAERGATALCCVPTLLATLEEPLPGLRLVIVSGEACPRDLVTRWHAPGRLLLNAYGPTETTVTATLGRPEPGRPVTIGRPLPTYAIVILAPGLAEALPRGEVGEIGIAGIGVARGYLNRDEQTRRAFIADFIGIAHNHSQRIYRTGDLGRVNADGEVEYLGRIDSQVKIRGYRIELAEVESALLQQPGVAQAVVQPWQAPSGVVELVAYYTVRPGAATPAADALARQLRSRLPAYMVPAFYVPLPQMPMLASDKADRKALPPPQGARAGGAQRPHVAPNGELQQALAEPLAELLGRPTVSAEDHFFFDLGLNSLLLAQYCARLRRQPLTAQVAMRDAYAHPSVAALAAHLGTADAAAGSQATRAWPADTRPPHVARRSAYLATGLAQLLLVLGYVWLQAVLAWWAQEWVLHAPDVPTAWARSAGAGSLVFLSVAGLPVVLKWLLVGRWTEDEFPVWSWRYLRFWALKQLLRLNPMSALAGTPLHLAYLRALGCRVDGSAHVALIQMPVCTDLVSIGAQAVVEANVRLSGYRVEGGRVRLGPVEVGAGAHVGDGALLDIHTRMGPSSQLAHASSLLAGQQVPAGELHHGCPARHAGAARPVLAEHEAQAVASGQGVTPTRRLLFTAVQVALLVLLWLPLPFLLLRLLLGHQADAVPAWLNAPAWQVAAAAAALQLGAQALALVAHVVVPRLLWPALAPGRRHVLYGWRHALLRLGRAWGNSKAFNALFGDSSAVVHYLAALGWRFPGRVQTGSNFGMAQMHDCAALCEAGAGTMVSDGLVMLNADWGAHSFRLRPARLGAANFVGNAVIVPPDSRAGDNCLLATKVMLPVHGPMRQGVGLLGSPCFEIPRSVARDAAYAHLNEPAERARRLRLKNRANLRAALGLLAGQALASALLALLWWAVHEELAHQPVLFLLLLSALGYALLLALFIGLDHLSRGLRRLVPCEMSIYDPAFWRHERHWKQGLAGDSPLLAPLAGTPLRAWVWRCMGVRVGRQLFDDGASLTEKTLVSLGDHCSLGEQCTLQGHSLEDGVFKSGPVRLGHGCTVGAKAYVHYDVALADAAVVAPDAFLMKGERPAAGEHWQGNPAQPISCAAPVPPAPAR